MCRFENREPAPEKPEPPPKKIFSNLIFVPNLIFYLLVNTAAAYEMLLLAAPAAASPLYLRFGFQWLSTDPNLSHECCPTVTRPLIAGQS